MSNTSYDLIEINGYAIPDVKKGTLTINKNPKYTEYENEVGGKVIDVVSDSMISGSVAYNGLLQSEVQAINAAIRLVSTMTIYNPYTGMTKTFKALVIQDAAEKIIHDANANAWATGFSFEEIGAVT